MRLVQKIALGLAFQVLLTLQVCAGESAGHSGYVVGFQSGYGRLNLRTDQGGDLTKGTYSLGFQGGYAVTSRLILGLEVNGWLLQAFNLQDPARGEAVSNAMLFLHVFPIKRQSVFLRTALGRAHYKNNHPGKYGGDGWGSWLIGGGYEVSISDHLYIAPQISYSRGGISDVPQILGRVTGRRYEVVDFSVALHWYSRK